jgi:hypothetical protein
MHILIEIVNGSKTLFSSLNFPWAHKKISWISTDNLGTRPCPTLGAAAPLKKVAFRNFANALKIAKLNKFNCLYNQAAFGFNIRHMAAYHQAESSKTFLSARLGKAKHVY